MPRSARAGASGRPGVNLDGLGTDQAFGDDPRHGVECGPVPEAFVNPQNQLDRMARLSGRDDPLDDASVDPLDADAMTNLETSDGSNWRRT